MDAPSKRLMRASSSGHPPVSLLAFSIGLLQELKRRVRAFRLEVRVLLPPIEVLLHEARVQRPALLRRIVEVVVGVDARDGTLRVVLADGVRATPKAMVLVNFIFLNMS